MSVPIVSINQKYDSQQRRRILLIEDNNVNRMLLSNYLGHCSYEVRSLSEASSFFSTLEQFEPELILLDLKLPDMDGYLLLEQIQQKPHVSRIPIIVVSAFAFRANQERAMRLGARRYFVKPVNLKNLITAIEEELGRNYE